MIKFYIIVLLITNLQEYFTPTNPKDKISTPYWKPIIDFDPDNFISEQVFNTSADGTQILMIITRKKGVEYDGKNPTILYVYGGFNASLRPSFSIENAVWMELRWYLCSSKS